MDFSIAHKAQEMNSIGQKLWPDGKVPWDEAKSPDVDHGVWTGQLRSCKYCGSMHPADVATAIRSGAKGSWADWEYGWPHKAYFDNIPNPHAGMLEVRGSASFVKEGWIATPDGGSHEVPRPAAAVTMHKFYTVHLRDASPEDKETIEVALGLHFEFGEDGSLSWRNI